MGEMTVETAAEVALLRHQAATIDRAVHLNLAGLSHEESLIRPQPAGNCSNWILGHMIYSYEQALPYLGQERVLPEASLSRYRRGTTPLEDSTEARDLVELIEAWDEAARRVDAGLLTLDVEALARPGTYFGGNSELPLGRYLSFTFFHQAYHSGQLGVLRRVAGKEGAIP